MITSSILTAYITHQLHKPMVHMAPRTTEVTNAGLTISQQEQRGITSIAQGSQRVPMLSFIAKASCAGDASIDAINLVRRGLGDREDIEGVYAASGFQRLSRPRQIGNRDGSVTLNLRGTTIPRCRSARITIYANFSPNAQVAGEHRFVFDRVNPIEANTTVSIEQTISQITNTSAGRVRGTILVDFLQLNKRIKVGRNRMLSRIRLRTDGRDHHLITAIRLKNDGSESDDDLLRLHLQNSRGHTVSKITPEMNNDSVTLMLNPPLRLNRGKTLILSLRGDVRRAQESVRFIVEDPASDITAVSVRR